MPPFSSPLSLAFFGVAVALHDRFVEDGAAPGGDCGSSCIGAVSGAACGRCAGGVCGDASRAHLRTKKIARNRRAFSSSSLCAAARARLLRARLDGAPARARESPPMPPFGLGLPGVGFSCRTVHVTVLSTWTRKECNSSFRAIAAACRMTRRVARPKFGRPAEVVRGVAGDERLCGAVII